MTRPAPWPTITLTLTGDGRLQLHQDTDGGVQVHINPPDGPDFGMVVPNNVFTDVAVLDTFGDSTLKPPR
jgi:hypothetical protein